LHHAPRRVLKYTGPTLRDLWSELNACLREAKAWEKKRNPPSRFKTIGTPEACRRQMESDLKRIYGENSAFRGQMDHPE